jgi:FAD binding domain
MSLNARVDHGALPSVSGANLKMPNGGSQQSHGDPMVLPPSITSAHFQQFIKRAQVVCGAENVFLIERADQLVDGTYKQPNKTHDMHAILERTYFVCSATISPRNVPEVQDMMRLCNEFDIPVWPFSIGRNTGYGGAAPRVPGSICLNLGKHINRVLEVNTEGAYALVEPGVTYFDLHEYLEKHNLREKVWMDVSIEELLTNLH